jgi:PIN domain nuclease of toxin-antitoxin system
VKLKTEQPQYALDSSAVIALVRREQGWEKVQSALEHSVISAISLTESMTKLIRQGGEPRLVERLLRALDLEVIPWDEELAWASRDLSPLAWTNGLSFADRACLTLARQLDLAAMTADKEWKKPGHGVRVCLFREGRRK